MVGGSCTGVFAAVRAARLGARVALIEKQNCFGGMATVGNVNIWHSLHDTEQRRPIIGGLTAEMLKQLTRRGAVQQTAHAETAFRLNTEELKIELDLLVRECNIRPFLHTLFAAPILKNGRLHAILIENKNGRQAVLGRYFVDATGDGDLALRAGVPRRKIHPLQPPTLCVKILGLDRLPPFDWIAALRNHGQEFGLEPDWGWGSPIPGLPDLQMRADFHVFGVDASNADSLTNAELEGRRKIRSFFDLLRQYGPTDRPVGLADIAASLGIRETPRFAALHRLTGREILFGRRFPDAIGNGSYRVDIHHADGPGITFRYLDGTEVVVPERGASPQRNRWRKPLSSNPTFYQIPYRSLLPRAGPPNLILAGRMLDADPVAFSAVRVMVNLNQTGEAAGVACALALEKGIPLANLPPERLRSRLAEGGSVIL